MKRVRLDESAPEAKAIRRTSEDLVMRRASRMPSATKHGAYRMGLLPGEDPAEFEKLHSDLVADFPLSGALAEDIVWTLTRLVWRKNHVDTARVAQRAWNRYRAIVSTQVSTQRQEIIARQQIERKELGLSYTESLHQELSPEAEKDLRKAAENEAREELGDDYKFIEAGADVTLKAVMENFESEARIDSMIDACVKRLLHLAGFKSLLSSTSSGALLPRPADKKAA
jgi:hypothetical protein